ncbi:MAG: hypothetical protein ABIJ57_15495 [Pseudomonadota bacterium]|nr:hypothetical protein [Pseudomonadota bacterium]MBU1185040.1 hypothetical protein [Pseudomonadota bacterium]MBU2027154.1 hypothetical protein [Pseudomonadota bacterium]MBU2234691.1 hypothetical protein [Pseudomonadota bacterium]MBU2252112.1 hypothetical protein [Pseudomonadota bacterium]
MVAVLSSALGSLRQSGEIADEGTGLDGRDAPARGDEEVTAALQMKLDSLLRVQTPPFRKLVDRIPGNLNE